jgi:undecaprenyl-diphosphatase
VDIGEKESHEATARPPKPPLLTRRRLFVVAGFALVLAVALTIFSVGDNAKALPDWQAFILGITQGLTELLPISSSGHLIIVPWLGSWHYLETHPAFNKTFDVALHLGTLIAVVVYFWTDIVNILRAWFVSLKRRTVENDEEHLAWLLLVATIPAAIAGAAGEHFIETKLGQPWMIAIALAVLGVVLWLADKLPQSNEMNSLRYRDGLALGLAQMLALVPGVSRSGIVITGGRLYKLNRDDAARISFLMAVPIIFGAVLLKAVKDIALGPALPAGWVGPFAVGVLAAAGSGLLAIWALLGYVRHHDYSIFVVYRLVLAAVIVILIVSNTLPATF